MWLASSVDLRDLELLDFSGFFSFDFLAIVTDANIDILERQKSLLLEDTLNF